MKRTLKVLYATPYCRVVRLEEEDRFFIEATCTSIAWYTQVAEMTKEQIQEFSAEPGYAERLGIAICKEGDSWPTAITDRHLEAAVKRAV